MGWDFDVLQGMCTVSADKKDHVCDEFDPTQQLTLHSHETLVVVFQELLLVGLQN